MARQLPKSNRIKKQQLQAKNDEKLRAKAAVKPKPVVHIMATKVRNLPKVIEDIFAGKKVDGYDRKIDNIKNAVTNHPCPKFLKEIFLKFAEYKIDFANIAAARYQGAAQDPFQNRSYNMLDALGNLARYPCKTIRKVEDWKPNSHNNIRQIAHFARHLYAKYEVPMFMDLSWYNGDHRYHDWFIHIGQGANIRTAGALPIDLTKKEAHFWLQAPKDFSPLSAFRYAQILNIGGNEPFVRQILRTRIATNFAANEFWLSVFRWLLANPMLDCAHYAPIVDYVHHQKFVPERYENGVQFPAQPNMTMKDRDPEVLLRQMEAWHRRLGKEKNTGPGYWSASGFPSLDMKTKESHFTITEILKQAELVKEGREMHHCVASYAHSCASGNCSIWTFDELGINGWEKRLTIEVNNRDRVIRQARKKWNGRPNASDMHYLRLWAKAANLSVSSYLI